jgi:hypothetical protein
MTCPHCARYRAELYTARNLVADVLDLLMEGRPFTARTLIESVVMTKETSVSPLVEEKEAEKKTCA